MSLPINTPRKVTLGLAQFAMSTEPDQNLAKAEELIRVAAKRGAQVICLPELFRSPYFPIVEKAPRDYSEPIEGKVLDRLSALAKELKVVIVAGSIFEASPDALYNTSYVLDVDGKLLGKYRKLHIPHDPGFFEQHYFAPGNLGYKVFSTPFGNIGVLICFDQWFPEAARAVALAGADIIFYPTAIGTVKGLAQSEGNWQEAWENVQRGHAIANNLVVAAVNRVGVEQDTEFWGGSFVCDAFGKTLVRGSKAEEVLVCEVDLNHGIYVRDSWRFFHNRRPDTYKELIAPGRVPRE